MTQQASPPTPDTTPPTAPPLHPGHWLAELADRDKIKYPVTRDESQILAGVLQQLLADTGAETFLLGAIYPDPAAGFQLYHGDHRVMVESAAFMLRKMMPGVKIKITHQGRNVDFQQYFNAAERAARATEMGKLAMKKETADAGRF